MTVSYAAPAFVDAGGVNVQVEAEGEEVEGGDAQESAYGGGGGVPAGAGEPEYSHNDPYGCRAYSADKGGSYWGRQYPRLRCGHCGELLIIQTSFSILATFFVSRPRVWHL